MFGSVIHFVPVFVCTAKASTGIRLEVRFSRVVSGKTMRSYFAYGYLVISLSSVEETVLVPSSCLCTFVKYEFTINMRV